MIRPANGLHGRLYPEGDDEFASWLRVAIRRQMEPDVLYCISNMSAQLCWNSLIEASFEDVGLCDPWAAWEVIQSYQEWNLQRPELTRRAILLRTALYLSRAPKSRIVSNCELTNVAHNKGQLEEEDKIVDMDPYREARLDAMRMTDPEPWPVRQSIICVARAVLQNDEPRSVRNATLLHLWGKGHLVWNTLLMLCDRFPNSYGWTKGCVGMYSQAWRCMMEFGDDDDVKKPRTAGLCSVVQGVLMLHPRTGVPRAPRKAPWSNVSTDNGLLIQGAARSDMKVWVSLASRVWSVDRAKKRAMPACALDVTTERGRKMEHGYEHFFTVSTIITNQPLQGPTDSYVEHAQSSIASEDAAAMGIQSMVELKAEDFRMGLCGSPPHSRSPSPGLRHLLPPPGSSSSMDEVPSYPASPTKKRRWGGGIMLPPGLQHYRNERMGWIIQITGPSIQTMLLADALRSILNRKKSNFCPRVLNMKTRRDRKVAAMAGEPWCKEDVLKNMIHARPYACGKLPLLGALAFRFVFEIQGGMIIRPIEADEDDPLYCVGEQKMMTGLSSDGGVQEEMREFFAELITDSQNPVLDVACEAMACWAQRLSENAGTLVKVFAGRDLPTFERTIQNAKFLTVRENWASMKFLCNARK